MDRASDSGEVIEMRLVGARVLKELAATELSIAVTEKEERRSPRMPLGNVKPTTKECDTGTVTHSNARAGEGGSKKLIVWSSTT